MCGPKQLGVHRHRRSEGVPPPASSRAQDGAQRAVSYRAAPSRKKTGFASCFFSGVRAGYCLAEDRESGRALEIRVSDISE